jgi:hypothetical protein
MAHSVRRELEWLERKLRNQAKAVGVGVSMKKESTRVRELEQLVRDMRRMRSEAEQAEDRIAASRLATVEVNAQRTLELIADLAAKRAVKAAPKEDAGEHARTMARVLSALDAHPDALEAVRSALAASEH